LSSDLLFQPSLTTPEMAEAVSDQAWLKALLRFEAALAQAESTLGLVSESNAAEIVAACDPGLFDLRKLGKATVAAANPVVPLVDELRRAVGPDAAADVHRGATSQDAIDTAMMLVARDGLDLILAGLSALAAECAGLAMRHRSDPMAGRTLLHRALPITFGLKCANWMIGVLEARTSLAVFYKNRLAVQLGGPVGTLNAFGERGFEVTTLLAQRLGLQAPEIPWQTTRNRIAELVTGLAIAAGAAAKIALDLLLLSQDEVAEVAVANPGRSSSMPHKRNVVQAVEARVAFAGVAAQASMLLGLLPGEHERAAGSWQAEWPAVSEALRLTAAAVDRTVQALTGLQVNTAQMRRNISISSGGVPDVGASEALIDRALAIYAREIKGR
jgi:3-carboxy-cis,cis-muconate cycloisomerase